LGNCRRNLEALVKNDLLALKANVFGPFHEASEVTSGLNILADTIVAGALLEKRVLGRLAVLAGLGDSEGS